MISGGENGSARMAIDEVATVSRRGSAPRSRRGAAIPEDHPGLPRCAGRAACTKPCRAPASFLGSRAGLPMAVITRLTES
jgi:hypothetical protein